MIRRLTVFLLTLAAAPQLFAQQSPSVARGFDPEKVYATSPVDNVSLFNGNLLVSVPLGETYVVSPNLSYTLHAIHNGKTWDFEEKQLWVDCQGFNCDQTSVLYTDWVDIPDRTANAGFDVRGQFPGFIQPGRAASNSRLLLFEGPDGAQHALYDSLHDGDDPDGA